MPTMFTPTRYSHTLHFQDGAIDSEVVNDQDSDSGMAHWPNLELNRTMENRLHQDLYSAASWPVPAELAGSSAAKRFIEKEGLNNLAMQ